MKKYGCVATMQDADGKCWTVKVVSNTSLKNANKLGLKFSKQYSDVSKNHCTSFYLQEEE